ncbi:hypothetical protein F4825DRAFT_452050 [Nemania diffusa]|nr:hypothetical protein F4825DRAFT_452050 [Nemania diffusa]
MADLRNRLKFGSRSRTPTTPPRTKSVEHKASGEHQPPDSRPPSSSRMSSHASPSKPMYESLPKDDDDDNASPFVRDQDQIWYNPSLIQMVEALQVQLMTHGVFHPLPVEFNAHVLHLLEGFAATRKSIRESQASCQEAAQLIKQNLEQFRRVADDWVERESRYQAELKRLEFLLLSKPSQDGLEASTSVTTNSMVDRSLFERPGLLSRLNSFTVDPSTHSTSLSNLFSTADQVSQIATRTIQASESGSAEKGKGPERARPARILDDKHDFMISEKFRQQDAIAKAHAVPGGRRAQWRSEALMPPLNEIKGSLAGFRNPFTAPPKNPVTLSRPRPNYREASLPTTAGVRDNASTDLSSSKPAHSQDDISCMPTIPASNVSNQAYGADTTKAAPGNEPGCSKLSFERREDLNLLPDNQVIDRREGEKCQRQHEAEHTTGSPTGSASSQERRSSIGKDNFFVRRIPSGRSTVSSQPRQARRGSSSSRQTVIRRSRSQSRPRRDSPVATSAATQETQQKQQAEMDAQIAATLALANTLDGSNQAE